MRSDFLVKRHLKIVELTLYGDTIHMIQDPSSLESTLDTMSEFSDKELADMKQRVGNKAKPDTVDLRAYKASRDAVDERSAFERIRDQVKRVFGYTPERELDKLIEQLSNQHATYTTHVNRLDKRVEEQGQKLKKVSEEHGLYQNRAAIVIEQYQRARTQSDRLEAELEQSGTGFSPATQNIRERHMSAQTEVRLLRHEADEAMRGYVGSKRRYEALSAQHQQTSARLSEFRRQEHHIGLVVDDARLQQEISVGGTEPSMIKQYELLGELAQQIGRKFETDFSNKTPLGIDTTFGAPANNYDNDPLVERWQRVR